MGNNDAGDNDYREFVEAINRETVTDDEYERLAARDALLDAYGLDHVPKPHRKKHKSLQPNAARLGYYWADYAGCMASRRVLKSADGSTALFSADQQGPVPPCLP